ncbi:glycosyltransferase family A protein [Hyphomicrobium sp. CS1BSMeth3]|uniref:glycosyltransferase family 2 protein n=1 Tax=Hyphomicrobium sp. CS1BSMeth3 TaxID=1892844 RepID=UPI0009FA829B|nr:glycosyltransferase family A protein [Hyphomicrobium sp. CS1BSMeth3]
MASDDSARVHGAAPCWRFERTSTVKRPSISVVMPVYNRADTVKAAVESVLALDETEFELIVVDDGSQDETREILGAIDCPVLTLVFLDTNAGANAARNIGASLARAPVLAFLDADDTYLPGRLALPLKALGKNPDVGVVLSSFTVAKREKSNIVRLPDRAYGSEELVRLLARHVLPPSTPGITMRRELFRAAGGFDPEVRRIQDREMLLRAARRTRGVSISEPLWHKNWQADGISSNLATYFAALMDLFDRHPLYHGAERGTRDYLIARHLVTLLLSLQFAQAWRDYKCARERFASTPATLPSLVLSYFATRRARRRSKLELFDK